MLVVVDVSVLIRLSRIGRFELVKSLYGSVVVSPGVYQEVVERGWGLPGSLETERAVDEGWIEVVRVANRKRVRELAREFGIQIANAETVQLALDVRPDFVLADEEEIRRLAEEREFMIRGCLGILIDGARKGFLSVSEARDGAEKLRASGYRVSREILKTFYNLLKGLEERG